MKYNIGKLTLAIKLFSLICEVSWYKIIKSAEVKFTLDDTHLVCEFHLELAAPRFNRGILSRIIYLKIPCNSFLIFLAILTCT